MLKAHFMHEPIEDNEQPQNSALKSLENQLIPRCGVKHCLWPPILQFL